jgi:hypothetical protein
MSALSTRSQTGRSLAKGPVAIVGVVGIVFGVAGLIFGGHGFSTGSIPHGAVTGTVWLGVMANGWTNLLFIAAGLLLVLGSSMHWSAKTSAFVVAGVLGAAAVIAVIRGDGVFGIFAANHRTEIVWGGAAIVLVLLAMLPRVGGGSRAVREPVVRDDRVRDDRVRDERVRDDRVPDDRVRNEPAAQDALVARRERTVHDEPVVSDERDVAVTDQDRTAHDEPVAGDEVSARDDRTARDEPLARDETVAPERG